MPLEHFARAVLISLSISSIPMCRLQGQENNKMRYKNRKEGNCFMHHRGNETGEKDIESTVLENSG
jgi:hypothetical protein